MLNLKNFKQLYNLLEDTEDDAFSRGFDVYNKLAEKLYIGQRDLMTTGFPYIRGIYATKASIMEIYEYITQMNGVDGFGCSIDFFHKLNYITSALELVPFIEQALSHNKGLTITTEGNYWAYSYILSNNLDTIINSGSKGPQPDVFLKYNVEERADNNLIQRIEEVETTLDYGNFRVLFPSTSPLAKYNNSPSIMGALMEVLYVNDYGNSSTIVASGRITPQQIFYKNASVIDFDDEDRKTELRAEVRGLRNNQDLIDKIIQTVVIQKTNYEVPIYDGGYLYFRPV